MLIVISTTFNTLASRIERCQYEAVNSPSTLTTQCCASLSGDTLDDAEANDLAEMLKALADPVRLRLVSLMANSDTGEVCACDLPDLLQRSQPTVSHHLGILTRHCRSRAKGQVGMVQHSPRPPATTQLGDQPPDRPCR